jgi:hypothetical protein
MLEVLFKDIKGEISYIWRIVFITVSIFLTTMIYGENINLQFDCETPNAVYEYEAGDTVEIVATVRNEGKAFETREYGWDWVKVSVYQKDENGNIDRLYYSHGYLQDQEIFVDGYELKFFNHGYVYEETYSFVIPEDAPKGDYMISISCYVEDDDRPENDGYHSETFEGLITVK